mgnify:CR=1 FL=1
MPGLKTLQFQFKANREQEKGNYPENYENIRSKRARDFAFLGDILKSHDHLDAAVIEYEKAIHQDDTLSPILYNKLALTMKIIRKYDRAEHILNKR